MRYKKEWLEALKTYPKTKGRLKDSQGYCCLGVLADITGNLSADKDGYGWVNDSTASLPYHLREELGLTLHDMKELMYLNDSNDTFKEVMECIKNING